MTGLTWAILGLTLGLALPAAILFFRQRSLQEPHTSLGGGGAARSNPAAPAPAPVQARTLGRWRAVAIRPGLECCQASQDLAGQRMLGKDAPLLPLALCSQPKDCKCTYTHYKDRRAGEERRMVFGTFGGFGQFGTNSGPPERRHRDDRRDRRALPPKTP